MQFLLLLSVLLLAVARSGFGEKEGKKEGITTTAAGPLLLSIKQHPGNTRPRCAPRPADKSRPRVAICFYGLSRNMIVLPSIELHIFDKLSKAGIQFDVFVHTFFLEEIINKRSGENHAVIDPYAFVKLRPCVYEVESQYEIRASLFEMWQSENGMRVVARNDVFKDGYESVKNLLCALHSLGRVGHLAKAYSARHNFSYDSVVALRPDVAYIRDIETTRLAALRSSDKVILTPNFADFQHGNGREYNDRFAIGGSDMMFSIYMQRLLGWAKHSPTVAGEAYLSILFKSHGITQHNSTMRVVRVRVSGQIQTFDHIIWHMNAPCAEVLSCMQCDLGSRCCTDYIFAKQCKCFYVGSDDHPMSSLRLPPPSLRESLSGFSNLLLSLSFVLCLCFVSGECSSASAGGKREAHTCV
jgi:hypothetical protein